MASSRRSGLFAAALLSLPVAGTAQSAGPLVLAGRLVVARGRDSLSLPGHVVVAHRIGGDRQGPVDSVASDAAGRFRFAFARPESTALYVVSSRYAGIGYFSEPFGSRARGGADAITLAVFDTAGAGAPLAVAVRHLVITRPEADGTRKVLDIVQVRNGGHTTRIGADSVTPTWRMQLPPGIARFEVGEGEVSPSAVREEDGRMLVAAPFPPGDKQVVVQYVLPRGSASLRIPIDQPTAKLELLVEDSTAAPASGLRVAEPMQLEGRNFGHFTAELLAAGAAPELRFGRGATGGLRWLPILAVATALLAALVPALRRGAARPPAKAEAAASGRDRDSVLRQIVALDNRYEAHEAVTPPAEWAAYREKRAALKAELARLLARP